MLDVELLIHGWEFMGEAKVLGQTFHVICYGVFSKTRQKRSTSHGAVDLNHQAPQLDGVFTKKWWHKFGRSFGTLWFRHIHVGSQEIGEAGSWIEAQLLSMTHIRMILIKALAAGLYRNPNLMYPLQSNTNYQKIPKILLEDIPIEMSISFGDFPVIFRVLWRWRYQRSETKASPSFLCRFWMFFDLKL